MESDRHMLGANRKRIEWIDAARGLAMCMIVFGHSVPGGFFKQLVYSFHVPVFFFLSGLVFHGNTRKNFGHFLWKEFKNLMLPYYGAGVISIAVYQVFGKLASARLAVSAKKGGFFLQIAGMLYGNCKTGYMKWNLPLWFLPCLFMVVLLSWGMLKILSKAAEENSRKRVCLLWISVGFFVFFGIYLTDQWQVAMLPLGLETSIRMLPFFLAGSGTAWVLKYTGQCEGRRKTHKMVILCLLSLVCFKICAFCAANNSLVLYHRDEYGKEAFFYLGAVSGICLIAAWGMLFERQKWISYIGQHTMVILLFHKFPILFCQVLVSSVGKRLEQSDPVAGILVAGLAIISCLLLEIIIKRIKNCFFRGLGTDKPKSALDNEKWM